MIPSSFFHTNIGKWEVATLTIGVARYFHIVHIMSI